MTRILYRSLLFFHPRHFRERFADEMLSIFDEIPASRDRAFLLYDALCSFAFQWLFRTNLWIFALALLPALVLAISGYIRMVTDPRKESSMRPGLCRIPIISLGSAAALSIPAINAMPIEHPVPRPC